MLWKPKKLGAKELTEQELAADKKSCRKIGPCGIGKKALYLNSFYIDRCYYVPVESVSRVFKRVAMSKGGFSGKGLFATIPYLVVVYDNGQEKQCNFKYEDQVDLFLARMQQEFPEIKTVSEAAEKRLEEAERAREQKPEVPLCGMALKEVERLECAKEYLEKQPVLFAEFSNAARKKRTYEQTKPYYKWGALLFTVLGIAALVSGLASLKSQASFAVWFVLFGIAGIFLFSGANVMPTSRNNRKAIEKRLETAEAQVAECKSHCPKELAVPSRYLHPVTLSRMIRLIREGRASDEKEALEQVKEDLKQLNASVQVSQEEYDEIMAVKPLFLIHDYQ